MKLISRYNIILLAISFAGLLLIGFLFYRTLSYYLDRQLDDDLVEEIMEVQDYTHTKNILPAPNYFEDLIVQYQKTEKVNGNRKFADTVFYNPKKKLRERARYLETDLKLGTESYRVLIIASKADREEEIKTICLIIILPVLLLLIIILIVNRIMIRNLWLPFRKLLINIKAFNLDKEHPFQPVDTQIEEFRELNTAVVEMSDKIRSDYRDIKLFTENASHEMMTPLAVINSKLDTILQSNLLGKEESETLTDLYKATSKLTRLNQSLLLLIKIDHNLLTDQEEIDIVQIITDKCTYFQELIAKRDLSIEMDLSPCHLLASRNLFEILVNNLFSNAIRHNYQGGKIRIVLHHNYLVFSNTSKNPKLDPERVFERFYKDTHSEGTGLGLSILKQICNRQRYSLEYNYEQQEHYFKIDFNPLQKV